MAALPRLGADFWRGADTRVSAFLIVEPLGTYRLAGVRDRCIFLRLLAVDLAQSGIRDCNLHSCTPQSDCCDTRDSLHNPKRLTNQSS